MIFIAERDMGSHGSLISLRPHEFVYIVRLIFDGIEFHEPLMWI